MFAGGGHLKPALAGYWEEVPNPYGDWVDPSDPNYSAWQSENALRANGTSSLYQESGAGSYTHNSNWQDGLDYAGFGGPGTLTATSSPGYTQSVSSTGKLRLKFHWVRDQINGQDDPNDNPPPVLNIIVYLDANASQGAGDVSNVDVETTLGIENGPSFSGDQELPTDDSEFYVSMCEKAIPVSISTSTIDANGDLWSPWFTYDGKAQADIGPTVYYDCEANLQYGFDWDFDNRTLAITSDIQNSYQQTFDDSYPTEDYRDGVRPDADDVLGPMRQGY